jgi:hypothetical protein
MRILGHLGIFLLFFLLVALTVGLLLASALVLRSGLAMLMLVPALPGLWLLYGRVYRAVVRPRPRRPATAPWR